MYKFDRDTQNFLNHYKHAKLYFVTIRHLLRILIFFAAAVLDYVDISNMVTENQKY